MAALVFTLATLLVVLFQLCLAIGLPWGAASMGGKFPGKYPSKMRWVAILNAIVLLVLIMIVVIRAGLVFPELLFYSSIAIWVVVLFALVGTILNSITPSKIERIWAPVALIQLISSAMVAFS
ncbi:hypothetical protein L0U88_01300 [Flavihumibacter sp. RY-1]|uniref:Uncharacterized protein n=1 Tax=Flavihumibacter fluminis TaxID=2909236 RepID=A0ABS9BDA0_9BACT|nr:hypothetical protein [Flavihumibacter fluminis]MCF1713260.1 hypothetical protein [Flavihumibacter fluminis]